MGKVQSHSLFKERRAVAAVNKALVILRNDRVATERELMLQAFAAASQARAS